MFFCNFTERQKIYYRQKRKPTVFNPQFFGHFHNSKADNTLGRKSDSAAYSRTLPALRIIENRYPEKITLEQLAQACGMSVSAFRRAFAGVYEQPPLAYLLRFRVEKARELLLLGFSVEETAQRTGFSDANYFVRYFRTVTGMTPGRFRRIY